MKKAVWMYCIASLFLIFEMAVQVSPSVMTTQLMQDLQMGVLGLGFMSGCYFYSYTAMQVPSGLLFDRFHPRLVMVAAISLCALGCIILGLSTSMWMACFSRILMGFGSAFAFVSVLVVTADLFSSKHFATLTGVTQMLASFGAMSGQLPVHVLVNYLGWRHTLFCFAFIGFLIALLVYCFLRYEKKLILVLNSKSSGSHFKAIVASRQTWAIAAYACLLWAPMSAFTSLWGVPFLINVDHFSAGTAAFICSLMWVGLAVASPLLGIISTRYQQRKIFLVLSAGIGAVVFAMVLFWQMNAVMVAILLLLAGAACSGQALSFTVVKENNAVPVVGTALALNNMAVVISGALFQPFIGGMLHYMAGHGSLTYRIALSGVFAAYLLGCGVAYLFINEPKQLH